MKQASLLSIGFAALAVIGVTGLTANADGADMQQIKAQEFATLRANLCPAPATETAASSSSQPADLAIDPARVFDNFYFVGNRTASAWALTTSDGIILFEAMFHYNVKETIVDGLKKLGLDPADIKYVIVSHGHNDHFGGAKYLQDTYGAHIVLSEADWTHMVTWPQRGSPAPFPKRDIVVKNGDEITLGDTTVKMVVTPGHTPGTLSPVFTVKDDGQSHYVGYWGGAAFSFLEPADLETYIHSAEAYEDADPRIDVELSNHVFVDGVLLKIEALKQRKPGDPHPFISGNAGFREWMEAILACANETLAQKREQKS